MRKLLLATAADVKEIIQMTNSDYTQQDSAVNECLAQASILVQTFVGRKLAYGNHVDSFNVPVLNGGTFRFYTRAIPVNQASLKLKYDPYRKWADVDYLESDAFELLDADKGIVQTSIYNDRAAPNGLRMEYSGGFEELVDEAYDDEEWELLKVPYELQAATAIQASFLMQRYLKNDTGKRGDEGSVVAKSSVNSITPDAAKLLYGYRMPRYRGI